MVIQKSESFHMNRMFETWGDAPDNSLNNNSDENPTSPQRISCLPIDETHATTPTKQTSGDVEIMKERFAKLLLAEDMSGGGKGVSTALALSNAITNLAASVFGEQSKLEPMSAERKARWRKEIGWLLSVTDHIVEFLPSQHKSSDGKNLEIMVTQQRNDLHMNIPALHKLDAMLMDCLDNFRDQNEFWYSSKEDNGDTRRNDEKWWLPTVQLPPQGLSEMTRKWLHFQKESVNQVLKAALAINAQVLSEMDIPETYIDSLPKNGKTSLGDSIYKSITVESFDPDEFLSTMDMSSEHRVLDLKNKIEASIIIWKRKMLKDGKSSSSPWGTTMSLEKRELFEERAETIMLLLKQRFPGLPQSSLDISKIQYNRDVGQSVLESYSRIIESLAYTVMSRIEDVLFADLLSQNPPECRTMEKVDSSKAILLPVKIASLEEEMVRAETPSSLTLSDFMGLQQEQEGDMRKNKSMGSLQSLLNAKDSIKLAKHVAVPILSNLTM